MANALLLPPQPIVAATASSTATGYSPMNPANDYAGVIWRSGVGDTCSIVFDLGADVPIDTILLFGLWGNILFATGRLGIALATSAQGPSFGPGWVDPNTYLPINGSPIRQGAAIFQWTAPTTGTPPPAAARYVAINGTGLGASGFLDISRAVIGKRIQLSLNFSYGAALGVRDLGSLDFSPRGVLMRRRGAKLRTAALTFPGVRREEVEATTKPLLERLGNTDMVGLVLDPADHPQRQNRSYYGPLVGDLGHVWRNAAAWEAKVNVVSIY